ncbi:MAG TPA: hypothetical protein VG142_00615 [Trebonia sp.]|jgi:3-methylfumaryl-CoA hydratase|nr:hypothetical protein [Trebonia sp.]
MGGDDGNVVTLSEALKGWQPGTVTTTRRVDPWTVGAFADLVGTPPPSLRPGDPLPPLWHWFTLLEHPKSAEIGADGHPRRGPFLPPVPGRRRMFAGGRLRLPVPIPIGEDLTGVAGVSDVRVKTGRSGEMAFVTVRTELFLGGVPAGEEEQDIVYRSAPEGTPPRNPRHRETGKPAPEGKWRYDLATDSVLLSRFSALTYNGHRIHFDKPYATEIEGYPDLVIHGPLLALLALELPRLHAPDKTVRAFEYRLVRPAFVPARILSAGQPSPAGDEVTLTVAASGASPSLNAKATLE